MYVRMQCHKNIDTRCLGVGGRKGREEGGDAFPYVLDQPRVDTINVAKVLPRA